MHCFDSIYSHGFIRAAVCIPSLRVADTKFNLERTLELARGASAENAAVALFPELGLSAYSNEDLFHQDALLDASKSSLARLVQESAELTPMLIVGAPLRFDGINSFETIAEPDFQTIPGKRLHCFNPNHVIRIGSVQAWRQVSWFPSAGKWEHSGVKLTRYA